MLKNYKIYRAKTDPVLGLANFLVACLPTRFYGKNMNYYHVWNSICYGKDLMAKGPPIDEVYPLDKQDSLARLTKVFKSKGPQVYDLLSKTSLQNILKEDQFSSSLTEPTSPSVSGSSSSSATVLDTKLARGGARESKKQDFFQLFDSYKLEAPKIHEPAAPQPLSAENQFSRLLGFFTAKDDDGNNFFHKLAKSPLKITVEQLKFFLTHSIPLLFVFNAVGQIPLDLAYENSNTVFLKVAKEVIANEKNKLTSDEIPPDLQESAGCLISLYSAILSKIEKNIENLNNASRLSSSSSSFFATARSEESIEEEEEDEEAAATLVALRQRTIGLLES